MEEIKKSKIVFASVLKPVDDTRTFEKMALSLSPTNLFDIHIIGYPSSLEPASDNITVHPLNAFKRLSLKRLWAPVKVLKKIWQIRPDVIVFNTHELLGVAVTMKVLTGCRICYDMQENYFRNVLFTKAFPLLLRPFLALYVRAKELAFSSLIDHFILAEQGYEKELRFIGKKKTILENRLRAPAIYMSKKSFEDDSVHLLFSGTLAESTGVFRAIHLAHELYKENKNIRLAIIGYAAQESVYHQINDAIKNLPFITLIGGNRLVPHSLILQEIVRSDFGIISYPRNPSTENSFPTKLYEYLGCRLPILLTNHKPWVEKCEPYSAAVEIDFEDIDADRILDDMRTKQFYAVKPQQVFWDDDAFNSVIKKLTAKGKIA